MTTYRKGWFWFLLILVLIAINQFIFTYFFKISYFDWYLKNGSTIGLVTVLVTFAFEGFDSQSGFISVNPRIYCSAYLQMIGSQTLSNGMATNDNLKESEDGSSLYMDIFDRPMQLLISLLLLAVYMLWMVVVVPIQYFPVLLLGGIGRINSRLRLKLIGRITDRQVIEVKKIPHEEKKPEGWMEIGIGSKPVKFTFILISTALAIVNFYRG